MYAWVIALSACNGPSPSPMSAGAVPPKQVSPAAEVSPSSTAPTRARIPIAEDDLERWLVVTEARGDAEGAWATGTFDAKRNKIDIQTQDVQAFTIDTGRIAIDWDRLVVLGIDGRNSELRRRDHPILRFARDRHGAWVVLEP